jgi:hypothetical protein
MERKKSILRAAVLMLGFMNGKWLLLVRRIHLYLGVFFAPLLLLFVTTGCWQTVVPRTQKPYGYDPSLIEKLSEVHTSQNFPVPGHNTNITWPTQCLVVVMCISLITSISLGLVLAFTLVRNKIPVWIALIFGIVVPIFFLLMLQLK